MPTLQDLAPYAILFVVVAVVLGVGATILATIQTGQTANSTAWNATGGGLTAIGTFSSWQNTLAIVVVAAVVIGVVATIFYNRK